MCGFIFLHSNKSLNYSEYFLKSSLDLFNYRGPDDQGYYYDHQTFIGHNRLHIIGNGNEGKQPSLKKNTYLVFNGEIYNYSELNKKYFPKHLFTCDTDLLHELLILNGIKCLTELRGMFSFVFFNFLTKEYYAVRDRFGIKPLFYYNDGSTIAFSSEPKPLVRIFNLSLDELSIQEWEKMRFYCPSYSYYKKINEVRPGYYLSKNKNYKWYELQPTVDDKEINSVLNGSIRLHCGINENVTSFISSGIDSSIIALYTNLKNYYSVGTKDHNEFNETRSFCKKSNKNVTCFEFTETELEEAWRHLCRTRAEPLSLPNEGLIFLLCKKIRNYKVILSGEGADELFFGYDVIFRKLSSQTKLDIKDFVKMYSYSKVKPTERFLEFVFELSHNKSPIQFCEDFFIQFHLPCLLRRLDSPSMIASKESRVPFVDHKLFEAFYRKSFQTKINERLAKVPLCQILSKLGYSEITTRKKIGFKTSNNSQTEIYTRFRDIVKKELL